MNAEIAQRIKEGRWEVVGGMWVEPDLNMPDGESLVRQLLVGKRWYKQHYGVDVRIGWNPDSFGYTWQLPQIYKKSGVDYFVTQKMTWNDTNQLPFKLFWWESPDGSKVLTYFPQDYGNTDLGPLRLSHDMAVARERAPGMTDMMDLYGVGDHGGGPTRAMLDQGFHWAVPGPCHAQISVRHRAAVLLRRREEDRPRIARHGTTNRLPKAIRRPPAVSGQDLDSHLGYRALSRIPPRRLSPPRPTTSATCATARRGAQRREVGVSRLARRQQIPRQTSSPRTGRRCSSTSSTISPPAPASASSIRTRRRITTWSAGRRTKSSPTRCQTIAERIDTAG